MAIDIQGFLVNKRFIIKELAAFDGDRTAHYIFMPPVHYDTLTAQDQTTAIWLTNCHHRLEWDSGNVSLEKLPDILQEITKKISIVAVKGLDKVKVLEWYINMARTQIYDVRGPKLEKTKPSCFGHHCNNDDDVMCALTNVKIIYNNLTVKCYEEF